MATDPSTNSATNADANPAITRDRVLRAKQVFLEVIDLPPDEQEAFLDRQCDDPQLRQHVRRLIESEKQAAGEYVDATFTLDWGRLASANSAGQGEPVTRDATHHRAQTASRARSFAPGDEIGHYVLQELLGRGGFGEVWKARQLEPVQREVAIKLLSHVAVDDELRRRFAFERQALARLEHDAVARIFDAGELPDGTPFLVMELAAGQAITKFVEQRSLSVRERLQLMERVCRGVHHAHQRGLIHCDLKPANVLTWDDTPGGKHADAEQRHVKIVDFGIAQMLDHEALDDDDAAWQGEEDLSKPARGSSAGTPQYMAPEQFDKSATSDVRSDVHALGLLLHEVLGGANPVLAAAGSSRRSAVIAAAKDVTTRRRPQPLTQLDGERVPGEVNWIVDRATESDPDARFDSAAAMADDIRRLLEVRPLTSGPQSWAYRLRTNARRNPAATAGVVAAVLALAGGVTATGIQAVRASRAEVRAVDERDE
ncbi:MAG: serine/threonine-protein kinase, partial [Planctomycetota bacterium]